MGTLNYNYRIEHTLKTKQKTFKMHGFEPQNMFTMMNSMMKDPEIQKFAKNFEEQMKNSMKDFQNSKNNETPNSTENSCPSSSSPKTTENSCSSPKTKNFSACPMFSTRMCNARVNHTRKVVFACDLKSYARAVFCVRFFVIFKADVRFLCKFFRKQHAIRTRIVRILKYFIL